MLYQDHEEYINSGDYYRRIAKAKISNSTHLYSYFNQSPTGLDLIRQDHDSHKLQGMICSNIGRTCNDGVIHSLATDKFIIIQMLTDELKESLMKINKVDHIENFELIMFDENKTTVIEQDDEVALGVRLGEVCKLLLGGEDTKTWFLVYNKSIEKYFVIKRIEQLNPF